MEDIIGFIFPVRPEHASSIFNKGKEVFVKFGRQTKLKTGSKALFYVSGKRLVVGEATIKAIEDMPPEKVWEKFGSKLFITRKELTKYAKTNPFGEKRITKELRVYILTQVVRYHEPFSLNKKMNLAGFYITKDEYLSLRKQKS